VLVGAVVGEHQLVLTILLLTIPAVGTSPTRVNHAPDRREVAGLEARDISAYPYHPPDDLMPWDDGVDRSGPLAPHGVQIGVTHAAVQDLDVYVGRERLAACKGERG
jgi:hypothetical protein